MADRSSIEWCDATWNPIRGVRGSWSCVKVSPGCQFCYAERLNVRRGGPAYKVGADELVLDHGILEAPLRWKRPRKIFVCSMGDLFEDRVPADWIQAIFDVMELASQHTFQVLTKRAARMAALMPHLRVIGGVKWRDVPHPNVWLGVSAEDQWRANERIPPLLQTSAAVRFVSLEPLLGPINLQGICSVPACFNSLLPGRYPRLEWVIAGGESGGPAERALVQPHGCLPRACGYAHKWEPTPGAADWVRSLRDQCQAAGVAFFFKQWGGPTAKSGGRMLDGRTWDEFPEVAA